MVIVIVMSMSMTSFDETSMAISYSWNILDCSKLDEHTRISSEIVIGKIRRVYREMIPSGHPGSRVFMVFLLLPDFMIMDQYQNSGCIYSAFKNTYILYFKL